MSDKNLETSTSKGLELTAEGREVIIKEDRKTLPGTLRGEDRIEPVTLPKGQSGWEKLVTWFKDVVIRPNKSGDEVAVPEYKREDGIREEVLEDNREDGRREEVLEDNREAGRRREYEELDQLQRDYPPEDGYRILRECYLRDEDGNIVKDPETGQARRIDFVVVDEDGEVVKSVEVTSETADKTAQMEKEERIREAGGNCIKDPETGELVRIPDDVTTELKQRP